MSKFTICYMKISKKLKLCITKQKVVVLFVRFNMKFVTIFLWLRFFYIQNQEKGGIQCQKQTKL